MEKGCYIFWGDSDYHPPQLRSKDWVSTWDLHDWKDFIDSLVELNISTLMIYLNGHKLPYKSSAFPELIDGEHLNCKKEYLSNVLEYAKTKKIKLVAVISTTGHAGGFLELKKESRIEYIKANFSENRFVAFPEHLQKGKTAKKAGRAQLGYGVLCHNKRISREYAKIILAEILSIYGEFFEGVALHPPELSKFCGCHECNTFFFRKTKEVLSNATCTQIKQFFITSYLEFQKNELFPLIKNACPSHKLLTFTIPWLFEDSFSKIVQYIPQEGIIIDWDYNLSKKRIHGLKLRLTKYRSGGNKVWFMPTGGFSFSETCSINNQIAAVQLQLKISQTVGIENCVYFLGPKMSPYLKIINK